METYFEPSEAVLDANSQEHGYGENLIEAMSSLSKDKPYAHFNSGFSENERATFESIRVDTFGKAEMLLDASNVAEEGYENIRLLLNRASDQNENISEGISGIVVEKLSDIIDATSRSIYVEIMVLDQNARKDTWHLDDNHAGEDLSIAIQGCKRLSFKYGMNLDCKEDKYPEDTLSGSSGELDYVISISLKGEKTLFVDVPVQYRVALASYFDTSFVSSNTANPLQDSVFIVNNKYGAFHRAPDPRGERVVMLVYPGGEALDEQDSLFALGGYLSGFENYDFERGHDYLCKHFNYCTTPANLTRYTWND